MASTRRRVAPLSLLGHSKPVNTAPFSAHRDRVAASVNAPAPARLESLDVLRGVAVLGIFVMNVQAFAMIPAAYHNPLAHMDFGASGAMIWRLQQSLFAGKFMTIFSTLFGAGLALSLAPTRDEAHRTRQRKRQNARLGWLLVFGLIHGFVFWHGDILAPYAVAGWIAASAATHGPRRLLMMAGGLFGLYLGLALMVELAFLAQTPEARAAFLAEAWSPSPARVAEVEDTYRGSIFARWPAHAALNTELLLYQVTVLLPRFLAAMLAGMALVKLGFFSGGAARGRVLMAALAAGSVGLAVSAWATQAQIAGGFAYVAGVPWRLAMDAVAPLTALGYAAAVCAWCVRGPAGVARRALASVGRMALSAYLASTLVGFCVFFGPPGLGLFGRVARLGQMGVVALVWAALLIGCPLWRRYVGQGPFERLWRSLSARTAAA